MELIGKWKVAKALYVDEDTFEKSWKSPADLIMEDKADDEYALLLNAVYVFEADGTVNVVMTIPDGISKEEVDEAVKEGEITLYGENMMLLEKSAWKEDDGKYYYDTKIEGTVFDEKADPWVEIKEADGTIEFMTFCLEKI